MRPVQRFPSRRGSQTQKAILLAAAVVMAGLGIFAADTFSKGSGQGAVPAPAPTVAAVELVECLVAIDKIEAGSPLDPSRFRKETRPVVSGSAHIISSYEKLRGAYAASFIAAGQPLLVDYVTMKAPINEIQANIPEGYRAVAVAVDDVSNVEGWVRAGAKVDVLFVSQVSGKPVIAILVQNAKVLSTG
jgi:pilus assembly protein CpaB